MGLTLFTSLLLSSLLASPPADKAAEAVRIQVTSLPRTSYVSSGEPLPTHLVEKAGDTERYLLGSVRMELRSGKQIFWGEDRTLGFLAGAVKVDAGWVFVATDGSFYSAQRFLGPLKRLGQVERHFFLARCQGRAAAVDEYGGLWTSLGGKAPALVKSLKEKVVLDAAFSSANEGLALVAPGEVLYTSDGGKNWIEVDMSDNGAFAVGLEGGRLALNTLDGLYALTPKGEFEVVATPEAAPVPSLDREKAERTVARRYPETLAWKPALADGRLVETSGREVRFRDAKTGAITGKLPDALPKGSKASCRTAAFRDGVAFLCPSDEAPQLSIWFTKDGSKVSRLADLYGDIQTVVVSEDRQGMAFAGFEGCAPYKPDSLANQLCVLLPGATEATPTGFELGADSDIEGMSGSTVLVYQSSDQEAPAHVLVGAKGSRSAIDLREAGQEEAFTDAHITADGLPYVVVREVIRTRGSKDATVGGVLRVLVSDANGTARIQQVPEGTMDFAFLDKSQALALGGSAADVWWSGDSGKTWRALALPSDGDASTLPGIASGPFAVNAPVPGENQVGPVLRCAGSSLCFAEFTQNRWLIRLQPAPAKVGKEARNPGAAKEAKGEAQPSDIGDAVFVAKKRKSALGEPAATSDLAERSSRWLNLQCEPASADLLSRWSYEPPDASSSVPIQPRPFGAVEAGLEFSVNIQGDPRFRVYWNYARKKLNYSTSSKPSAPPWQDWVKPNVQKWQDKSPATYRMVGGSEGAVWFERCVGETCRLVAAPSDGLPVLLPEWVVAGSPLKMEELSFDTDGTGYLHLSAPKGVARGDLHVLMRVAADGTLAQRRVVLFPPWSAKEVHLSKLGGTYGLLGGTWGAQQPEFLFFALGSEEDSSPDLPQTRQATSCPPKSETGTSYWENSNQLVFQMQLGSTPVEAATDALVQWSLVNGTWCVSTVDLSVHSNLPALMVGSGQKEHMDNPPAPVKREVPELQEEVEEESEEPAAEPPAPKVGEFSGETEQPDTEAPEEAAEDPDDAGDPAEATEALQQKAAGAAFADPAADRQPDRPTDLGIRLYFAAVQGMFTGYLVGGSEPLQLLCTAKPVAVEHK